MDLTPEPCPECAAGNAHEDPTEPHVHATDYGYAIYAPNLEARDYIEEIRNAAYRAGREDAARDLDAKIIAGMARPFAPGEIPTAERIRAWLKPLIQENERGNE